MPILPNFPRLLHGGDYNPDQWLAHPDVIDADFKLMEEAGCNVFSVGIFAWSQYELEEGRFTFEWMDDIFDRAGRAGIKLFLATPTGARPAWLGINYPETNRVDYNRVRQHWGSRHNHCWTSPVMREKTAAIIRKLAERYANRPELAGWHVSNEYGGDCFCDLCRARFIEFLKERHKTVDALNAAWWSAFWGHRVSDWSQINIHEWCSDGMTLDWKRFQTFLLTDFFKFELGVIRELSNAPATTNMMGFHGDIDYWRVAPHCDFIADDCYPDWSPGKAEATASMFAMIHDLHYTMQNKPFLIMESTPGIPQYMPHPRLRRPGEFEREALLALGHGADGILYFQWRKGLGMHEKYHGAVVDHEGGNQSAVFQRVAELGARLKRLEGLMDAVRKPEAAVVYDWESTWAIRGTCGFGGNAGHILDVANRHHAALCRCGIPVAVIESRHDFSPYKLVAMPMLFMFRDGLAEKIRAFVENGGTLLVTGLSGYVDENNLCLRGGYPGGAETRKFFGVWNEDVDCLSPDDVQTVRFEGQSFQPVRRFAERLHAEGAEVVAVFERDVLAGLPALTRRKAGKGEVWYLGTEGGDDLLDVLYERLLNGAGIKSVLPGLPPAVRVMLRQSASTDYYFLINLSNEPLPVELPRPMEDVWNGLPVASRVLLPPNGGTLLAAPRT